jgi:hypothetical protein
LISTLSANVLTVAGRLRFKSGDVGRSPSIGHDDSANVSFQITIQCEQPCRPFFLGTTNVARFSTIVTCILYCFIFYMMRMCNSEFYVLVCTLSTPIYC